MSMFSTRLPVSTGIRRSRPPGTDVTSSFSSQNRPSNIPLTVKKANLFTPQTKRPSLMSTNTTTKSPFSTASKYQRPSKPMQDRETQMQMFENLIGYLKTNATHMPLPEAKRFFSSISTTESSRIFEFLIGKLLPDFKITRLEVDVPEALAQLDYPYIRSVTKSALVSVATRQAAVGLLIIFNWLVCLIQHNNSNVVFERDPNDDWKTRLCKTIGQPPEDDVSDALIEQVCPNYDLQSKIDENQKILEEIQTFDQYLEDLDKKTQKLQNFNHDAKTAEEYCSSVDKYLQTKRTLLRQLEDRLNPIKTNNETISGRYEGVRFSIEKHEFNLNDVRQDQAKLQMLNIELEEYGPKVEILEREITDWFKFDTQRQEKSCGRFGQEFDIMKQNHANTLAQIKAKSDEEESKTSAVRDEYETKLHLVEKELKSFPDRSKHKTNEAQAIIALSIKSLAVVVEAAERKITSVVEGVRRRDMRWMKTRNAHNENMSIAQQASKQLKFH